MSTTFHLNNAKETIALLVHVVLELIPKVKYQSKLSKWKPLLEVAI